MASQWRPMMSRGATRGRATCIHNYNVPPDPANLNLLSLYLGDTVVILAETDDWYFGHTLTSIKGLFPKSYVYFNENDVEQEPLVVETNATLKEWYDILKENFQIDDMSTVAEIKGVMKEVSGYRSELATMKLTVEKAKQTREKLVTKTDFLNGRLGLDLVVRDANAVILEPESTSAVSLFRSHVESARNSNAVQLRKPSKPEKSVGTNSFRIILQMKNFDSPKITEDVDLIIGIYDVAKGSAGEYKVTPICESFVIENWKKNGNNDEKERRVQFGDLSKNDISNLDNHRKFLICNVVSYGNYGKYLGPGVELQNTKNFRKPIGVAACDITHKFTFNLGTQHSAENINCSFLEGDETETLFTTFKRFDSDNKRTTLVPNVLQVELGVFYDSADTANEHQYGAGHLLVAKRLGLPEVIFPSDVRNDLYINILHGELGRLEKLQDRNVEVCMEVCDSQGVPVAGVISMGPGHKPTNSFSAVVYRHDGKPRWNEVVKVLLPQDCEDCHIRFTFTHRSRQDKYNPPYAMSFVKLNTDEGTTIADQDHQLAVYKIGSKVDIKGNPFYLNMSSHKKGIKDKDKKDNGLTFIQRDVFVINTILASTQLTQNEGVLALLLRRDLSKIKQITKQEFAKCMSQVLDALFNILAGNEDDSRLDRKVFKELVELILGIVEENSDFKHFIPAFESYIEESFCHPTSYLKILEVVIDGFDDYDQNPNDFNKITKCLQYIFKLVVRSRQLYMNNQGGDEGKEEFEEGLKGVLGSIIRLMHLPTSDKARALLNRSQRDCLKQIILSLPDLSKVYPKTELAENLLKMIDALPLDDDNLDISKLEGIKALVHSPLFPIPECRQILLHPMASHIQRSLKRNESRVVEAATNALGEILDKLNGLDRTDFDTNELMLKCLGILIHKVTNRQGDNDTNKAVVTNLICLLHQMNDQHYDAYVKHIMEDSEPYFFQLNGFVSEVINLFRGLIENNVFPDQWNSMIMLQNSVIMKVLCYLAHTIHDHFLTDDDFDREVWIKFFRCSISFVKQKSLQLETFSENKRLKIAKSYKDMRIKMGQEVKRMWNNLGKHKIRFIPDMIGDFLELALIKDKKREVMKSTIEIFFDMIQCESLNNQGEFRADFSDFKREFITKLDLSIDQDGLGDDLFLKSYKSIMTSKCKQHITLCESGTAYVDMTSQLIRMLLDYQFYRTDSKDNQMSCLVNLLYFYQDIDRDDLYAKYLRELADLHQKCQNYTEAGFSLLRYAEKLEWSHQQLIHSWGDEYQHCQNELELKEQLYKEIIDLFDKGKMWEKALQICEELSFQYKNELFDYGKLSKTYNQMGTFYEQIMSTNEVKRMPEYFRVVFVGKGFPPFLQNKTYIFRGKGCDNLMEFKAKILEMFPNAEPMKTLDPPTQEEREGLEKKIQICKVDPIMDEEKAIWKGKSQVLAPQILKYYKMNDVKRFKYDKPNQRGPKKSDNEHKTLWIKRTIWETRDTFPTILECLPVIDEQHIELSPIEVATTFMQKSNEGLKMIIQGFDESKNGGSKKVEPDFNQLSGLLDGQIKAFVAGGTENYEKAFLTPEYLEEHPEDEDKVEELKHAICYQIPLLELGLKIHDVKRPAELAPMQELLEEIFLKMKVKVESNYGPVECDLSMRFEPANRVSRTGPELQRQDTLVPPNHNDSSDGDNRSSYNSQVSYAEPPNNVTSTPSQSRNLLPNFGGLGRRKSSASQLNRMDESRSSSHSFSKLNTTMEQVNEELQTRLIITDNTRRNHGMYLTASTPNNSRSPSNSNRDSLISTDSGPPMLPIKSRGGNDSNDNNSLLNFDANSNASGSREDICITKPYNRLKKPPPPPPPVDNGGSSTPPMPRRKPPLRSPTD